LWKKYVQFILMNFNKSYIHSLIITKEHQLKKKKTVFNNLYHFKYLKPFN